jgi:hypothetical protein
MTEINFMFRKFTQIQFSSYLKGRIEEEDNTLYIKKLHLLRAILGGARRRCK